MFNFLFCYKQKKIIKVTIAAKKALKTRILVLQGYHENERENARESLKFKTEVHCSEITEQSST